MAALLAAIKGRFILSLNDRPDARALFADFRIEKETTRYSANWSAAKRQVGALVTSCKKEAIQYLMRHCYLCHGHPATAFHPPFAYLPRYLGERLALFG